MSGRKSKKRPLEDGSGAPPPPSISLSSGAPVSMSEEQRAHWESAQGGAMAARRGWELDVVRLLGSARLTFTADAAETGEGLARALGLRERATKPRKPEARWCRDSKSGAAARALAASAEIAPDGADTSCREGWHAASGEVEGQGHALPSKLLSALHAGSAGLGGGEGTPRAAARQRRVGAL